MNQQERQTVITEALQHIADSNLNLMRCEDAGQPEHWVQVWAGEPSGRFHLEASSRAIPGSPLPVLMARQVRRLVDLGFGREALPHFQADLHPTDLDALAETIE